MDRAYDERSNTEGSISYDGEEASCVLYCEEDIVIGGVVVKVSILRKVVKMIPRQEQ